MTAQRGDFDSPHTDRTTEPDDVFDARLDIAADVREEAVARAICEADVDVDAVSWAWDGTDKDTRDQYREMARAAIAADPGPDTADQLRQRVHDLAAPGDPDARMQAYYFGFERTGVGIVDAILSAVAQAGKSYHGTENWADEDEWTTPSHEARIQAAANEAAARLRAVAGPRRDEEATA